MKINKNKSRYDTPQHYVSMEIISPFILDNSIEISEEQFEAHGLPGLPIKNVEDACNAVKNVHGWDNSVVDRIIDSVNRYDVPRRHTFALLDSVYSTSLDPKQVIMMSGWMYQYAKTFEEDLSFITNRWYNDFNIEPWKHNPNYQFDTNNLYVKFENDKVNVFARDLSRIQDVALHLISEKLK